MLWLLLVVALLVLTFGVSEGYHSYYPHYFSYAERKQETPYLRLNQYKWWYGPDYVAPSELGGVSKNYRPKYF